MSHENPETIAQHAREIRTRAKELARYAEAHLPPTRERALIITNLQQGALWCTPLIHPDE